jgi:hypothetical protein
MALRYLFINQFKMKITELRSLIREAVKAQLKEAKMSKEKIEGLIWSLENEIRPWHPSDNSKKKAMLDKLKKDLSKRKFGIKENEGSKYTVIRTGGSAGEKSFKKEFDSEEKAKEYAKRSNSLLSSGEKNYYNIKYKVVAPKSEVSSLKEAITVKWDVDTNEPYNDKDEKKYATSFKISFDPITVTNVVGQIDEDYTDLGIDFSNGDKIYLQMSFNGQSSCIITKASDKSKEDVTKYLERFMGSSGTVTGDLCILYKYYIEGKLK